MHALEYDATDPIRVLLVEDHVAFRQALSLLLYNHQQMEVLQAGTLAEARLLLGEVDVVGLDNLLPDGAGVDLIRDIHASNRDIPVLVLSDASDQPSLDSALAAGADRVVSKGDRASRIIDEIKLLGDSRRGLRRPRWPEDSL